MFEEWAIIVANQLKKINPEETEPHDVLVFGFTIFFNLLFTSLLIILLGWLLGVLLLAIQVMVSFILLRILTGGAHLDQSLACSLTSLSLIGAFVWLPSSPLFVFSYFAISIVLVLIYAPYYETHQVQHSKAWEQKKKRIAILWVMITLLIYQLFAQSGFVFGALLQALLLTPAGVTVIHKLNTILTYIGGGKHEKNS